MIRISDTGCGIPESQFEKVFEPFFTQKGEAGTGLGLAMVSSIVAANRGALAIQSWPDSGTIFEIWWPLEAPASNAPDARRRSVPHAATLADKAVLVVDDNPGVVDTLVAMIEELGGEAGPCLDPRDAIAALRDDVAVWDLVITDYDMPRMDGAQLARELRRVRPDLPILLLTALPRVHQMHQKHVGLFDRVLGKPADTRDLAIAAAEAISAARERTLQCAS